MKQVTVDFSVMLAIANRDPEARRILEGIFPEVFMYEQELEKPYCMIGSVLVRTTTNSIYALIHIRKQNQIILININDGYVFTKALLANTLKDKEKRSITMRELNLITDNKALEFKEIPLLEHKYCTNKNPVPHKNVLLGPQAGLSTGINPLPNTFAVPSNSIPGPFSNTDTKVSISCHDEALVEPAKKLHE